MTDMRILLVNKKDSDFSEWVDLPNYGLDEVVTRLSAGEDEERIARIEGEKEEGDGVEIEDSEGLPFIIPNNPDLDELNEFAELVDDAHDENEILAAAKAFDEAGYDLSDIIHKIRKNYYSAYSGNLTYVAECMVDEGLFGDIPKDSTLMNYIDYERLGEDLRHDGYEYYPEYGYTIRIDD